MASPKLVLETVRQQCLARPERRPGYRHELLETVAGILSLERDHRISPTNIVQKMQDQVEALGYRLVQSDPGDSTSRG